MKNKYELFNEIAINEKLKEDYPLSDKEKVNLYNKLVKDIKRDNYRDKKNYRKIAIASVLCLSIATVELNNEKVWH